MRRFNLIVCLSLAALLLAPLSLSAQTLGAAITPDQSVPPGVGIARGDATLTFDAALQHVTVTINATDLAAPPSQNIDVRIGEGGFGVRGTTVLNLTQLGAEYQNGTITGTFAIPTDVAQRMLANPNNFYVQITAFSRGQLAYVNGGPAHLFAPVFAAPHVLSGARGAALVTVNPYSGRVTWEINMNDSVGGATSAEIHRGAAGEDGPAILKIVTSPSAIEAGIARGSGFIDDLKTADFTPADLAALLNPEAMSNYYLLIKSELVPAGEARGQFALAREVYVPVVGHITNGAGQKFITDLEIFDPRYEHRADEALIEYFPSGRQSDLPAYSSPLAIGGRGGIAVKDPLKTIWGLQQSIGAMRITSSYQLLANSHTYLDERAIGRGTLGQSAPGVSQFNTLQRGVLTQLANGSTAIDSYRTNLGFFNPTDSAVAVALTVLTEHNAQITTVILPPHAHVQNALASFFTGDAAADVANAPESGVWFDAAAPIVAYASVVDNVSGDSSYVSAVADPVPPANRF